MDPNKIPIDKKIHETSTQFFICLAQVLFTEPDIKAASEEAVSYTHLTLPTSTHV